MAWTEAAREAAKMTRARHKRFKLRLKEGKDTIYPGTERLLGSNPEMRKRTASLLKQMRAGKNYESRSNQDSTISLAARSTFARNLLRQKGG